MTLQEFPSVGPFRDRIQRDLVTRVRIFNIREILPTGGFSRVGVQIWNRADLELLSSVILAALRDSAMF